MKISKLSFPIGIILLLFSCNYLPCGWDSDLQILKQAPLINELVGVYKPDSITKQNISGFRLAEFVLDSNGNLVFKNIPIGALDIERQNDQSPMNGVGRWDVNSNAQISVNLKFEGHEAGFRTSYRLYNKNGRKVIFMIIGDPDECSAARFVQEGYSR